MAAQTMTSPLNTLANTEATIQALATKFNFDPVEARKVVAAAFARALQAELPIDAKQAVAETSGLAADAKPKRVPAAFELWSQANRADIRATLPEGTKSPEVNKALREAWKALDDEARAPFVEESKRLRAAAKPPADPNAKRTRRRKDPNAPKGPKNAFMRYADTVRPALIAAARADLVGDAKVNMSEIARKMGVMWKALDDEVKAPFETAFKNDKARYAIDKAEWDAKQALAAEGVDVAAAEADVSEAILEDRQKEIYA